MKVVSPQPVMLPSIFMATKLSVEEKTLWKPVFVGKLEPPP